MLLQSPAPCSAETTLSFASNHEKEELMCEWVPPKTWKSCVKCDEPNPRSKRRKLQNNFVVIFPVDPEIDEMPIQGAKRGPSETEVDHVINSSDKTLTTSGVFGDVNASVPYWQKLEDDSPTPVKYLMISDVYSKSQVASSENEPSSNSFSSLELQMGVSSVTEVNDFTKCLNSDILGLETLDGDLSLNDLCISVLRSHGLLEGAWPVKCRASIEVSRSTSGHIQTCKLCGISENTLNMLLCDHCEEAFHVSCCNFRSKMLPNDEWFCQCCSEMKCTVSKEASFLKSCGVNWMYGTSKFALDRISSMLKCPEPYTSRVRIGKPFQAEIPDWSNHISDDVNCIGESTEMDPAETEYLHRCCFHKPSRANSISNWLQCRDVLYGDSSKSVEGTICGKWRRAPYSEVQTDDWDCSCSVLWDPIHADCAVAQELETEKVFEHLKYVEQLKSRLAAKTEKI